MSDPIKRAQQSWCPACRRKAGRDCPDVAVSHRQAAKKDRRIWKAAIARHIL